MLAAVSFAGVGTADRSMLPLLAAVSLAGVNVGFVPTDSAAARAALAWAGVGPGDSVFELGCGDGRVAEEALELGASVVCVESDPELAAVAATRLRRAAGSRPERARVLTTDLFEVDLSQASACSPLQRRVRAAEGTRTHRTHPRTRALPEWPPWPGSAWRGAAQPSLAVRLVPCAWPFHPSRSSALSA